MLFQSHRPAAKLVPSLLMFVCTTWSTLPRCSQAMNSLDNGSVDWSMHLLKRGYVQSGGWWLTLNTPLCLPDPIDRPGRKTHHPNLHFSLVQIIAVYIKNFPTVSSSVFIKGEKMGKNLWQGNNNKMYATQRWWEDIMVFYIFDIEPKLSHRKEVMNLHSLIITPS